MPSNSPKNSTGMRRFLKAASFWILVILIPVAVIQFSGGRNDPAVQLNYTQYSQELERGNIAKVTFQAGKALAGDFRQRISMGGRDYKRFTLRLPVENAYQEVERAKEKGVTIDAQDARPSVGALLINLLPYFLLIGLWILIFRQMQAGGA